MAKATKKTTETEPKKRGPNRSADEIVAELQRKIEAVRARAAVKEARANPAAKALIAAAKGLDKALATANEHRATEIARALEAARAPLSTALVERGIKAPESGKRRGRKPAAA